MDVREALAALALDQLVPSEELRRAYLRRVKVVRPERDPEGFRQLREAYELLCRVDWEEVAEAPGVPEPIVEREPARAAEASAPVAPAPPAPVPSRAVDEAAFRALKDPATPRPERLRLLRALIAQGQPLLPAIAQEFPEELTAEELDELCASPAPWVRQLGLVCLLERGRGDAGARLLAELERDLEGAMGHVSPTLFLRGHLRLHELGQINEARELSRRLRQWFAADPARLNVGDQGPLLSFGPGLDLLPDQFPQEVRSILAAAMLRGDLDHALGPLEAFAERNPAAAQLAADYLSYVPFDVQSLRSTLWRRAKQSTEGVRSLVEPVPPSLHAPPPRVSLWRRFPRLAKVLRWGCLVHLGLLAVTLLLEFLRPGTPRPAAVPRGVPVITWTTFQKLCEPPPRPDLGAACAAAQRVLRAAQSADCAALASGLEAWDREFDALGRPSSLANLAARLATLPNPPECSEPGRSP